MSAYDIQVLALLGAFTAGCLSGLALFGMGRR